MPWHLSKSDPRKVYDQNHDTVCVCMSAEQAATIVRAVNALPVGDRDTFIRLREPAVSDATGDPTPLETFHQDDCCTSRLIRAHRIGVEQWVCPNCGTDWKPRMIEGVRHWEPHPAFFSLKAARSFGR